MSPSFTSFDLCAFLTNVSIGHTCHIVSSLQTELVDTVLNVIQTQHKLLLAFHLQTWVHILSSQVDMTGSWLLAICIISFLPR